ncbi:MAG: hypothetical protein LWX11_00460, partial [Firmicutes bacterium]|nr:hypothetical protein [Bacillota bacterium]
PQALTRAALRNQILERKSVLVAIKNDFMVLQPRGFYRGMDSSQVLLDASQGQGFWLKGWGDETGDRFSLPISRYAPIQMVDARR